MVPAGHYGYYGSPWFYGGWGYPYAYGYAPWGYPYAYGGGYYDDASLRLQVSPRETEVFVDGYFAGTVDDFDGTFQRLHLEPGDHDLELYLPGHRSFQQKVYTAAWQDVQRPPRDGAAGAPAMRSRAARRADLEPRALAVVTTQSSTRREIAITSAVEEQAPGSDAGRAVGVRLAGAARAAWRCELSPSMVSRGTTREDNERLIVQLGSGVHTCRSARTAIART